MSVRRQCVLLGIHRSQLYDEPVPETAENLELMRLIDGQYLKTPFWGSRNMTIFLRRRGYTVNRKRTQRFMGTMGLEGLAPGPSTSRPAPGCKVYPYLLKDVVVERPNQVWSNDITYVPLQRGFLYLVAVMDWYSRHVLSWRLSNSLEVEFCVEALDCAAGQRTHASGISHQQ
ncbi:MAG: DDE-type integrase/transposase/recombinase [Planctomycetaceae bacterium]